MKEFMNKAIQLAKLGMGKVNPNPMVGAVIVRDGNIIGAGYHKGYGAPHAEVEAFNSLKESALGAEMYVTLEPCNHFGKTPPCTHEIVKRGISKVYVATLDPNPLVSGSGVEYLREHGIEVEVGLMKAEANRLNEVFMKYIQTNKPFVHLKMAMSLDGKIATITGDSKWISSDSSREEVHKFRNKYSSIMVGVNTVNIDNPRLTSRIENGNNPVRVVCDSRLSINKDSNVLDGAVRTIIASTVNGDIENTEIYKTDGNKVNLEKLMRYLGEEGIDSVLLEGGSTLAYSALEANVVDKVTFYIAPIIIGGEEAPTSIGGKGVESIKETFKLDDIRTRIVGSDVVIEGYIK